MIERRRHTPSRALGAALLVVALVSRAGAHSGPPFPMIVDQPLGPVVVSVWGDPDIGVGTFYVTFAAPPGGAIPADLAVDLVVQPVSGRLPEVRYTATRDATTDRVQFTAEAQFDRQEMWKVRFVVHSSAGTNELSTEVEATPPGLGPFDVVLYLLPFLAVAFIWGRAMLRHRSRRTQSRSR